MSQRELRRLAMDVHNMASRLPTGSPGASNQEPQDFSSEFKKVTTASLDDLKDLISKALEKFGDHCTVLNDNFQSCMEQIICIYILSSSKI